jgi:hypothetical protein
MIKITLQFAGDNSEIIIRGNELLFFDIGSGMMTTVEGLKLSKSGCIKEFPDLKDDEEWKKKSIERLKENMNKFDTEMEKMNYVKNELEKQGYQSLFWQKGGWRPQKFKNG